MGIIDKAYERLKRFETIDTKEAVRQLSFIRFNEKEIKKILKDLEFFGFLKFDKKRKVYIVQRGF